MTTLVDQDDLDDLPPVVALVVQSLRSTSRPLGFRPKFAEPWNIGRLCGGFFWERAWVGGDGRTRYATTLMYRADV